ncbi:MAG: glycerophosphodiester phosphodiesterase [Sulfuritalea sp.]|nr:glycerophosphodiester phosphodiesterase [Sulfuritalea sp.]
MRYPRIIAHRCGGRLAMENTIAGLVAAKQCGCRAVEFDVMLTADRVPILMHDETLDRTTRIGGRVAALTLAQIRAGDGRVPTLGEAVGACERLGLWANIELKPAAGHEEETGEVVCRWLARNWNGHGVISSFSARSALAGRRALPAAAFALLCCGLPADWSAQAGRLDAVAVHLGGQWVDAAAAAQLAAAGLPWAAWTVNDAATAERLFSLGAAALITDRPDLLLPAFA